MATGYTHDVQNGKITDFDTFAKQCIRAMGVCIMQRDDGADAKLETTFKASQYSAKRAVKDRQELMKFASMNAAQILSWGKKEKTQNIKYHKDRIAQAMQEKERYEVMLGKVLGWTPPTKEHDGFKSFMIEQLKTSIDFDCDTEYHEKELRKIENISVFEAFSKKLEEMARSIGYSVKSQHEEDERTKSRQKYMDDFLKSLEAKPLKKAKSKKSLRRN